MADETQAERPMAERHEWKGSDGVLRAAVEQATKSAGEPLPEDPSERQWFDRNAALLGGPLSAVATWLGIWASLNPSQGSYAKMLAICSNELRREEAEAMALRADNEALRGEVAYWKRLAEERLTLYEAVTALRGVLTKERGAAKVRREEIAALKALVGRQQAYLKSGETFYDEKVAILADPIGIAALRELQELRAEAERSKNGQKRIAWLIEVDATTYWDGRALDSFHFVQDAIRFSRQEDAERIIRWLLKNPALKATEHVWLATAAPPAEPQEAGEGPSIPKPKCPWDTHGECPYCRGEECAICGPSISPECPHSESERHPINGGPGFDGEGRPLLHDPEGDFVREKTAALEIDAQRRVKPKTGKGPRCPVHPWVPEPCPECEAKIAGGL